MFIFIMAGIRAVAVAVLLVLGGCSGLAPEFDGDDPQQTPTATETGDNEGPTASPTGDSTETETLTDAEADSEPEYLAPGLTTEGVLNVSLLLDDHYAVLEQESGDGIYAAVMRSTRAELDFPAEKIGTSYQQYSVRYPGRWHHVRSHTNQTSNETTVHEEWADDSESLFRINHPDEPVEYDARDWSTIPSHPDRLDQDLRLLLRPVDLRRSVDVTVVEQVRDESTVYVVSDTTHDGATTVTTTFHIREDGHILRYSQNAIQEQSSGERIVSNRYLTFETHPDGELEPPDWIEDANEATNEEDTPNE